MAETDDQSPYGRGFIAACIVIAAILLCGGLLIITGLTSTASPSPDQAASSSTAVTTAPGKVVTSGPGEVATPPGVRGSGAGSACGLPAGDQVIPVTAPPVDGWEVSRRVVVPRSAVFGPAKVDPDGFRRCFAQSPSGAVFAGYSAISALADQRQSVATVGKLMLPGPDTEALLRELRKESPEEDPAASQIAGYRVLDASKERATVALAMPVESAFVSATLTLVWHQGDWRVVPPASGEPVGAPYAQLRNLDGFVAWSGV